MIWVLLTLKMLHIASVAVWLGGGLTAPRDVRQTLALGQPHTTELMKRLRAVAKLMNFSAGLTVVTGLSLVLMTSGLRAAPLRIHLGIALTFAAIAAGRVLIRPAIEQIVESTKRTISTDEAQRIASKFAMAVNTEHALRAAVLILMVYPFSF